MNSRNAIADFDTNRPFPFQSIAYRLNYFQSRGAWLLRKKKKRKQKLRSSGTASRSDIIIAKVQEAETFTRPPPLRPCALSRAVLSLSLSRYFI